MTQTNSRVAIVYDWADTSLGGAEKVLLALAQLYPQAELFVGYRTPGVTWPDRFAGVHTTWLQKLPLFVRRHKKWLAPLLPLAFESLRLGTYDLVISVTSFAAKGVLTKPEQLHLCYLLTPTRFLYSHRDSYLTGWRRLLTRPIWRHLRRWDSIAVWRPDRLIAISQLVADRSEKYYGRRPDKIIYPTIIDRPEKIPQKSRGQHFLFVGRLTAYKKCALAIKACGEAGVPLRIVGQGPQRPQLERLIASRHYQNIKFLGAVSDHTLHRLYATSQALIAPGLEDFGITLLEAANYGLPIIAHPQSGARELLSNQGIYELDPDHELTSLIQIIKGLAVKPPSQVARPKGNTATFKKEWTKMVNAYAKK